MLRTKVEKQLLGMPCKSMQDEILKFGVKSRCPEEINQTALKHLKEIMEAPGDFVKVTNERGIQFLEKKLSVGRGVRLNLDGTFKGFPDQ